MTARRTAASVAAFGLVPLALTLVTASPAAAHGSMSDPVSRVSACFAEGPENPQSAACKAAVEASGTQAFYDWNEVNIANAAGRHREIIPDGELCSAGRDKYKGLDLPRTDWPASEMTAGDHTFRYRATAPHRGAIELYLTKESYDPAKPLKWSDLEEKPFATVQDPKAVNGEYVFDGTVPERSGRHLIYSIWQRSDSPEAFYTCSDVVFGGDGAADAGPAAQDAGAGTGSGSGSGGDAPDRPAAPTDEQIAAGADESTVDHGGHGGDGPGEGRTGDGDGAEEAAAGTEPKSAGKKEVALAQTGGDDSTATVALGGAAALAVGTGVLFVTLRHRARRRLG